MTQPFLGQIQPFAFSFAPRQWAMCNGQLMGIAQNQALFSLLGTTYGGNGVNTFQLPDLRGRVGVGQGTQTPLGQSAGVENVTLITTNFPAHLHTFSGTDANADAALVGANGSVPATIFNFRGGTPPPPPDPRYGPSASPQGLYSGSLTMAGSSLPHPNMQPYLAINFCICLNGIFPSRN